MVAAAELLLEFELELLLLLLLLLLVLLLLVLLDDALAVCLDRDRLRGRGPLCRPIAKRDERSSCLESPRLLPLLRRGPRDVEEAPRLSSKMPVSRPNE